MKVILKRLTQMSLIFMILCSVIYYKWNMRIFFSLSITFGTAFYHFAMRLAVGGVVNLIMHNQADYRKKWFRPLAFEKNLYKILKVKQWKNKMPTYDSEKFSVKVFSYDAIAQAMCQAEVVHEVIIVFSFLPILAAYWFGALPVFVITSIGAVAVDLMFVIMQRYNRPRIVRLAERKCKNTDKKK